MLEQAGGYLFDGDTSDRTVNNFDVAGLYGMYDALAAAHPGYVTREALGKDASGEYDLLCYTIESRPGSGKPEILWVSNVHGDEHNAAMSTYYMVRELLEHWQDDPVLRMIFTNCCLRVIPLGNPWGWQNASRNNYNGVNLNRDFPVSWSYLTSEKNRTDVTSMSQPETQIIMAWVEAHKENALVLVNKHDTGAMGGKMSDASTRYVGYLRSTVAGSARALKAAGDFMDMVVRRDADWVNEADFPGYLSGDLWPAYSGISAGGTLDSYAGFIGVPSYLSETCIGGLTSKQHVDDLCRLGVTANVNALASHIISNADVFAHTEQVETYKAYRGDPDNVGTRIEIVYDPETGTWSDAE